MNIISPYKDQTLSELLSKYVLAVDLKLFLDTKDPIANSTNWDRIKRKYSEEELEANESKYPSGDLLVKQGTQLELRVSYIKRNIPKIVQQTLFKSTTFKPFITAQMAELLKDPRYTRDVNSYSGERIATLVNNDITVFVWCRALTPPNSNSQEGSWLNISNLVKDIEMQTSPQGGSFSFSLPSVACEWSDNFGWRVAENIVGFDSGSVLDDTLSETSLLKYNPKDPGFYWREKFLFNTILQENDLVYIKFEKLTIDQQLDVRLRQTDYRISSIDAANKVWDMIGLVDSVVLNTTPNASTASVSGRDMMKLLIEDGSYFFPEQFAQNIFTKEDSILTKRNRIELIAQSLSAASYTFKRIDTILKFIFNKFSNIGIVPNSVFNGYGENAIRDKYELKRSELQSVGGGDVIDKFNATFLSEERQGCWRICEFVFDPQVAERVLADNSISQDNGSIINSIKKVCQEPFVEFSGDTYKDKYYFFVRKQPFDAIGYRGLVYDNFVSERKDFAINSNTKVGRDNRLKQASMREVDIRQQSTGRAFDLSDLVVDIDDVDVLGEPQLTYHEEAYSWYRIIPRGLGIIDEATSFLLAPVVPLDEYAEVWGNRTFSIEYNYSPTEYLQDSQFNSEAKYAESQVFYDLQYVIQSNQYLPFTRQGVITLIGNRTIKRGLFIYFKPTREVFYVDGVAHSKSIEGNQQNRFTVLRVSRGMREPYIKGKLVKFPSGEKLVSYFDIVNTDIDNEASINNKNFLKNWGVNRDLFNFFLQRRQWVD